MAKKLTLTALWMMSHPNDVPCPKSPGAAVAWRRKRFQSPRHVAEQEKYEAMMAETRAAEME